MIRHFVLMTFHDAADAPEAQARLEALPAAIAEIRNLEVGLDVAHSEASAHLALVTTHDSLEALGAYQKHPLHETFSQWARPRLSGRVVVDLRSAEGQGDAPR